MTNTNRYINRFLQFLGSCGRSLLRSAGPHRASDLDDGFIKTEIEQARLASLTGASEVHSDPPTDRPAIVCPPVQVCGPDQVPPVRLVDRAQVGSPARAPKKGEGNSCPKRPGSRLTLSPRFLEAQKALRLAWYTVEPWKGGNLPTSLEVLVGRFEKVARHSGEEYSLVQMKEFLSDCRVAWLGDSPLRHPMGRGLALNNQMLAALSMVRRALPFPSERDVAKAVAEHKRVFQEEFRTDPALLLDFRSFCRRWALSHLDAGALPELLAVPQSACLEKTRREGGVASVIREWVGDSRELEGVPDRPEWCLPVPWDLEVAKARAVAGALEGFRALGVVRGRVEVIREYGLKSRIVTKSPASLIVIAHIARRRLFKGLYRTPEVSDVLRHDMDAVLKRFVGSIGLVCSSDLKAATDRLPLDLMRAGVEGLIESGRFSQPEAEALLKCVGPMELEYPDGSTILTKRGILMGLPTSWSLLNLVHVWWWKRALMESRRLHHGKGTFACCGDDALLVAEKPVLDAYDDLIVRCGGELSPGKHSRSRGRGVFLERLFRFEGRCVIRRASFAAPKGARTMQFMVSRNLKVETFKFEGAIPLKGVLHPTMGGDSGGGAVQDLPIWYTLGSTIENLGRKFPADRLFRAQKFLYSGLMAEFRRRKIPPIPRSLGGSGLLPDEQGWRGSIKKHASERMRKAIAVLVTDESESRDPSFFTDVWKAAMKGMPEWIFDEARGTPAQFGYIRVDTRKPGAVPDGWMRCDGLIESVAQDFLLQTQLCCQMVLTPWKQKSVETKIHRRRDLLAARWGSARPVSQRSVAYWASRVDELQLKDSFITRGVPPEAVGLPSSGPEGVRLLPTMVEGVQSRMRNVLISSLGGLSSLAFKQVGGPPFP